MHLRPEEGIRAFSSFVLKNKGLRDQNFLKKGLKGPTFKSLFSFDKTKLCGELVNLNSNSKNFTTRNFSVIQTRLIT